ncbi:MAG: acetylornithine deacetylase [marine bacterium B5-7]|nr:MAG: acetylornithine deacetylase [marine bacterium B5-7]
MNLERSIEILSDLIAFPTISSDSNMNLIDYAGERLQALGANIELTYDTDRNKANLFATLGPDTDGGIVLSGHTDVVPVEGQPWSVDPFTPVIRGERMYGRGACDMKAFIACALAMAPRFREADLVKPVHFAFSFDEEVGCLGAPLMLEQVDRSGHKPSMCIVGEPTGMRVIEGHKGCYEYNTVFTGLEGHCSMPDHGVNAVEYAARFVTYLMEVAEELKTRAPTDSVFDPPWTTIQTGMMSGGIARNVIPRHCQVDWEMRPVNGADARLALDKIHHYANNYLAREMQARHVDAKVFTHVIGEVAGLEPMPHSEALKVARELTGDTEKSVVSFSTEAGLFQEKDISTVVCGPGSISQAHKPDEYVDFDQVQLCLDMIEGLVPRLTTWNLSQNGCSPSSFNQKRP